MSQQPAPPQTPRPGPGATAAPSACPVTPPTPRHAAMPDACLAPGTGPLRPFLSLPARPGTGMGTGTGTSQPTLPARGTPASSRPRCQPQSRLACMPPRGFGNVQPPLPQRRQQWAPCPLPARRRTWVTIGFPSAGAAAGQTDIATGHPQLRSLLPARSTPGGAGISGEVPSLRVRCRQRSAAAHGTRMPQHPPWQRARRSGQWGTDPCQPHSEQGCNPKSSPVPR